MALDFPAEPTLGQTYSVNNSIWVWNGTQWTSLTTSVNISGTIYSQEFSGATGIQSVNHNLNTDDIFVSCWGATGATGLQLVSTSVNIIDENNVDLYFYEPFTGKVVVRG